MHTWYYRLNALATLASTTLGVLCLLASGTDLLHKNSVDVQASLLQVERLQRDGTNDRAWVGIKLHADLSSLFTWNTKQAYVYVTLDYASPKNPVNKVTIWDRILQNATAAVLHEPRLGVEWPYALTDEGRNLRGTAFNVTVSWETVPMAGALLAGHKSFGPYSFPDKYSESSGRT